MAPYRHYPHKNALLAAVAAAGYSRLYTDLQNADTQGDWREKLAAQAVAYVRFAVVPHAWIGRIDAGRQTR